MVGFLPSEYGGVHKQQHRLAYQIICLSNMEGGSQIPQKMGMLDLSQLSTTKISEFGLEHVGLIYWSVI